MKLVVFNVPVTIFMQVPDDSTDDVSKVEARESAKHILQKDVEGSKHGDCSVHEVQIGPLDFIEIIEF